MVFELGHAFRFLAQSNVELPTLILMLAHKNQPSAVNQISIDMMIVIFIRPLVDKPQSYITTTDPQ